MNNILEMIKNEKVEWKKLGDVCEIGTGKSNTNQQVENGKYPFYVRSKDIKRIDEYEFDEEAIIIPGEGGIGEIYHYINGKYALHQRAYRIHVLKDYIKSKYVYYYMQAYFYNFILKSAVGSTVSSIRKGMIENFEIPIPSLKTQERIVKILDTMVDHFTQLEAELEARNKQYEYYRDKLLSEEYLNKLTNKLLQLKISENLSFISLEDLVDVVVGEDVPKHSLSKTKNEVFNIPIYSNGTEEKSLYGYTENARVFDNSITVSARGTIGYVSFKKEPYYPIVRLICLIPKKDNFNLKFLYYFLQQYKFNYVETGIPSLTSDMVKKIKVPVPNIEVQNTIVDFLDRFQAIIQDVDGLLPKEIELRKKQYEYYRERLLDFKRDDE